MKRAFAAALLTAALSPGELLRVEQSFGGIDCAGCASSIVARLKRLRGVSEAEEKDSKVRVVLEEGNRVKLSVIRDIVKGTGYTPGEAAIAARGRLEQTAGQWRFTVEDQVFAVDAAPPGAQAGHAEVEGAVPASGAGEPLRLRILRLAPLAAAP
jgi:copper chaperone CopZ